MEERQEGQDFVFGAQIKALQSIVLQRVGDDVCVREHDTLGQPRRPRRINQEGQVLVGVDLDPAVRVTTGIADRSPVLDSPILVPLVPEQDDVLRQDPAPLGSDSGDAAVQLQRRDQDLGPAVLKLERQLVARIRRVRGADDPARPVRAPYYAAVVYVVRREQAQHVALLERVLCAEALAEGGGFLARLAVGVVASGVGVDEEFWKSVSNEKIREICGCWNTLWLLGN